MQVVTEWWCNGSAARDFVRGGCFVSVVYISESNTEMAVRRFLTDEAIVNLLFEDIGRESDDDGEERLGVPNIVNHSNLDDSSDNEYTHPIVCHKKTPVIE